MIWFAIGFLALAGIGVILARTEISPLQEAFFGGRMHPGCVVIEGILLLLLALAFYGGYLAGLFP